MLYQWSIDLISGHITSKYDHWTLGVSNAFEGCLGVLDQWSVDLTSGHLTSKCVYQALGLGLAPSTTGREHNWPRAQLAVSKTDNEHNWP